MSKNIYDEWNDNNNLPKMKNCPFCNGKGILCNNGYEGIIYGENGSYEDIDMSEGDTFWCECEVCGVMVGGESTPNEAIEKWNRRFSINERKRYPYPLTIIQDRYSGMSAGGIFTAWNREVECIPDEVYGEDFESIGFWEEYWNNYENITRDFDVIGVGNTPNEAVDDLIQRLKDKNLFIG